MGGERRVGGTDGAFGLSRHAVAECESAYRAAPAFDSDPAQRFDRCAIRGHDPVLVPKNHEGNGAGCCDKTCVAEYGQDCSGGLTKGGHRSSLPTRRLQTSTGEENWSGIFG